MLARVWHGLLREVTSQTFLVPRNPVRKTVEAVLVPFPAPQMFCEGHERLLVNIGIVELLTLGRSSFIVSSENHRDPLVLKRV